MECFPHPSQVINYSAHLASLYQVVWLAADSHQSYRRPYSACEWTNLRMLRRLVHPSPDSSLHPVQIASELHIYLRPDTDRAAVSVSMSSFDQCYGQIHQFWKFMSLPCTWARTHCGSHGVERRLRSLARSCLGAYRRRSWSGSFGFFSHPW